MDGSLSLIHGFGVILIIQQQSPTISTPPFGCKTTTTASTSIAQYTMTEWHPLRSLDDNKVSALWSKYNKEAEKVAKEIPDAKMPSLDHLKMKDFEQVYEPSDDTVSTETKSTVCKTI
jgi:hypothetical protein